MRRGSGREAPRRGTRITTSPAAIIVAAGRGERARTPGSKVPKQLHEIGGRPAVAWSIDVMAAAGCAPIVVALPPDQMHVARDLTGAEQLAFVPGGATRQDSVWNALDAISSESILIHDGARPLVTLSLVHDVIAALEGADAVVPVLPVDDTLKEVEGKLVVGTIDRSRFRRVQTPQGFRANVLRDAHVAARADGFVATDDAQLVERSGGRVVTVDGRFENLKLTRPDDFTIASLYLRGR